MIENTEKNKIPKMLEKGENFHILPMRKGSKKPHLSTAGKAIIHGLIQKEGENILYTHIPSLCGSKPRERSIGWIKSAQDVSCDICNRELDRIYLQIKARKDDAKNRSPKESA